MLLRETKTKEKTMDFFNSSEIEIKPTSTTDVRERLRLVVLATAAELVSTGHTVSLGTTNSIFNMGTIPAITGVDGTATRCKFNLVNATGKPWGGFKVALKGTDSEGKNKTYPEPKGGFNIPKTAERVKTLLWNFKR